MTDRRIQVILADDHPVIRVGMEAAIQSAPTMALVGTAADSTGLIRLLETHRCDVLVTDYAMPGGHYGDGMQLLGYLRQRFPDVEIVVMTGLDDPAMMQALHTAGIERILSKADDTSHLLAAINASFARRRYHSPTITALLPLHTSRAGTTTLSPREREVLALYVQGMTINEIAQRLERRKQTISTQKVNGMAKLGIQRDAELFKYAAELGLKSAPVP